MKRVFVFIILAALFLTSCENFLKAKEVQSQIEDSIAYANASVYTIAITTEKSSGIVTKPAGGEAKVKPSDTFNLSFYAESDHQFIRWEVYNTTTNKAIESNEYFTIENPDLPDTTATLIKVPENSNITLGVRAITAVRPQINFTAPNYITGGVHRNSTITVRFDHNMDENSIYYTKEEKQKLKDELGLSDSDFLISGEEKGYVCYGYKKDGKKHFKNIQIESDSVPSDWENQALGYSKDIYDYYDVPYFEDKYNRILKLPASLDPPVGQFDTLTVIINKDCFYSLDNNTHVTMRESKSWLFNLQKNGDKGFTIEGPYPNRNPHISVNNGSTYIVYTCTNEYIDNNNIVTYTETGLSEPPVEQLKLPSGAQETLSMPAPLSIPESSDPEKIKLGFALCVNDYTGTGVKPYFTIIFCNAEPDEAGNIQYRVKVPYLSRKYEEDYGDTIRATGYAGEMTDLYWVEIPRTERLSEAKAYSFKLEFENYEECYTAHDNNGRPIYYWIKTTSTTPTTTP